MRGLLSFHMLFLVSACFKTSKNLFGSSKMTQKESKEYLPDYLFFPDNIGYLLDTLVGQCQNCLVGDGFARYFFPTPFLMCSLQLTCSSFSSLDLPRTTNSLTTCTDTDTDYSGFMLRCAPFFLPKALQNDLRIGKTHEKGLFYMSWSPLMSRVHLTSSFLVSS